MFALIPKERRLIMKTRLRNWKRDLSEIKNGFYEVRSAQKPDHRIV